MTPVQLGELDLGEYAARNANAGANLVPEVAAEVAAGVAGGTEVAAAKPPALLRQLDEALHLALAMPETRLPELVQPIGGQERVPARQLRSAVLLMAGLVAVALVWAGFSSIEQVAVANGTMEAAGRDRPIEAPETALVDEVLVAAGQQVVAGQSLLRLSSAGAQEDLASAQANLAAALATQAALGQGGARMALQAAQSDAAQARLAQRGEEMALVQTQIGVASRAASIARDDLARARRLFDQQALTRSVLNQREAQANEALGRVAQLQRQAQALGAARAEAAAELGALGRQQALQLAEQRQATLVQVAQARAALARAQRRAELLEVRSPVAGIIKDVPVTPGRIVAGGAPMLAVTPVGAGVVAELLLPARSAPGVHAGSAVRLQPQIDNGADHWVTGRVQSVSPSSFADAAGARYFKLRVALGAEGARLQAGTEISGRIPLGRITVLDYLLNPVRRGLRRTFEE